LVETNEWRSSGTTTIYVYRDDGNRPLDDGLFVDDFGPVDRVFTGEYRLGFKVFWHTVHISIAIPQGRWWFGLRDGRATGEGSAAWTVSPDEEYKGSTGFVSFDRGTEWEPEGPQWHHAFQVWGFVQGEPGGGYFREIAPVDFSGEPVGGVEEIRDADDQYYELTAAVTSRVSRAHNASAIFATKLPVFPLLALGVESESRTTHTTVRQELAIYDFGADAWMILDDRPLQTDRDERVAIDRLSIPDRFLKRDDGTVRMRVECYSPGTTLTPHTLRLDQLRLVLTYAPIE
jgi:hypothetical protein